MTSAPGEGKEEDSTGPAPGEGKEEGTKTLIQHLTVHWRWYHYWCGGDLDMPDPKLNWICPSCKSYFTYYANSSRMLSQKNHDSFIVILYFYTLTFYKQELCSLTHTAPPLRPPAINLIFRN